MVEYTGIHTPTYNCIYTRSCIRRQATPERNVASTRLIVRAFGRLFSQTIIKDVPDPSLSVYSI